jgi:hypothetical protein
VSPSLQVEAALAAFPDARFHSYRLPDQQNDAALVHLALPEPGAMRDVFISPLGERDVGGFKAAYDSFNLRLGVVPAYSTMLHPGAPRSAYVGTRYRF